MKVEIIPQRFKVLTELFIIQSFIQNIEKYGRVCYKSEKNITKSSSQKFVRNLIKLKHESVLEHFNLTIHFTLDRAIANALVRHRHCAFSQESTHFINYLKKDIIQIIDPVNMDIIKYRKSIQTIINEYEKNKALPSSIRRSLLPLGLKTELIMTTNLREWRHILRIRTQSNCHPQMRNLILGVLYWFKVICPILVEDILQEIED